MRDARLRGLKVAVFVLCLVPLGKLLLEVFGVGGLTLGANPVEELLHRCGLWGLNFLLITLAVSPARQLTGWAWITRFRRMLGLFAFFYVLLHFLVYLGLDQRFAFRPVLEDVIERPYITIGFAALLILTALAGTSTRGMMRRLGRRWKTLHRLVYPAAVLGVWHFYWQVKLDTLDATLYAAALAALLGYRLWRWRRARRAPSQSRAGSASAP
jgi:sulfoxide reductase heme-binding subunit YedZ